MTLPSLADHHRSTSRPSSNASTLLCKMASFQPRLLSRPVQLHQHLATPLCMPPSTDHDTTWPCLNVIRHGFAQRTRPRLLPLPWIAPSCPSFRIPESLKIHIMRRRKSRPNPTCQLSTGTPVFPAASALARELSGPKLLPVCWLVKRGCHHPQSCFSADSSLIARHLPDKRRSPEQKNTDCP